MKRLCEEYALALYELSEESNAVGVVMEQMSDICRLLKENPGYIKLLDNPAVEKETRTKLAHDAFAEAEKYLLNFIMLLTESKSMNEFEGCTKAFSRLYDEKYNIVRADAVTASPLDSKQIGKIIAKLEAKTGKTVILTNTVDCSVIGGVLLRYGTEQIDMSVSTSLNKISEMILKADI